MIAYADGQDRFPCCYVFCGKVGTNPLEEFRFTDHKVDWQGEEIEVSYSVQVLGPVTFPEVVHTRDSWLNGGHPPVL